jgi:VWFA-related protein
MESRSALIVTTLALCTCVAARAQDVAPGARIEVAAAAKAEIVRLDVVVTDEQGKLVGNLGREDFDVLEDGKPQRLADFVFLAGSGAGRGGGQPAATEGASAAEPGQNPGRYIAIVVDELHLSRRSLEPVRGLLARFLDRTAAADDYIALVSVGSPTGIVQPTRDRAVLKQAIARITARGDAIATGQGAQLTPEQAEQIVRGDQDALQLGTRLQVDEAGSVFSGLTPRSAAGSTPDRAGVDSGDKGAADDVLAQARNLLGEALSRTDVSLGTVEDVLRALEPLPGRKLCLFVSDGFLVGKGTSEERTQELRQVTDAATRSGTAIYPLMASGLTPIGSDASAQGGAGPAGLRDRVARTSEKQMLGSMLGLAEDTGGFVVRGSDATDAGLARMLADNDAVYLLGYEPSNQKRDGRFRKIVVRLPRHANYVVRTRQGYFAPGGKPRARQVKRAALPFGPAEAQAALGSLPGSGIPVRIAADYVELNPGGPHAVVKAVVDVAGLPWKKMDGKQRADFDLIGGIFDVNGQPGPLFAGQHYGLSLAPADYEKLKQTGVRYEGNVPLKPGRYEIRMLALDAAHAPLGGGARAIEIPDVGEKKLTMSSVFLLSSAGGAAGAGELRDAQVLRRFKTTDTLFFQVYVYNAARDGAGASDVVLQAQIHAAGKPPFASKPRQALLQEKNGAPLPEGDGIPLAGLAPGSYELRIVVADRKASAVVARSVDFTVE